MILDGGSVINTTSMTLVDKLQLHTKVHLTSCTLQWLKQENEVTFFKQAFIFFLIDPYIREVICDVLLLLGRPQLYDNHVNHDGHANTHALQHNNVSLELAPLHPPKPGNIEPKKGSERNLYMSETMQKKPLAIASSYLPC